MSWETLLSTTLVPVASVVSTATVAVWTKRIDARTKREDRDHALVLDYEKRAGDDKKAVLKRLISATLYLKRGSHSRAPKSLKRAPAEGGLGPSESCTNSAQGWVSTTESPS